MIREDEINDIVVALLNSIDNRTTKEPSIDCGFCLRIEELDEARDNLKNLAADEHCPTVEWLSRRVIHLSVAVQGELIEWAELRQEQDLRVAVKLLTKKLEKSHKRTAS